ncbi:hypothetical protein Taro_008730 [Colocasia esculenta]|uniref:Aminotransferase-like plant mobile domain-containing protein n=1 Tax=Colocasia esculenta TaxID=4460 RepID=A0A843U7U8_COLES|nr:hypothetical protein [Colocasia esculenta]
MKRNYSAFQEGIHPYSGPKAAKESYAKLQPLSAIPGHICMRPELQILPGHRWFSRVPWLAPMLELLPPASISHLKEWGLSTVLVLANKYDKMVHVWDSVTALAERWHPQTHTFVFPTFEPTVLLEELEIMLGLPRYQRGEELAISYTVAPINSWSILAEITTRKTDLQSMTSGMHVHLLPIAQWIISQCKRKTGNYQAIAKAAAICICRVILFPTTDGAISFANLSIVDSISEGMSIGQAVLGFLYAGLSSAAMGGPFLGSIIALELWMGIHIQFRAMGELATECKTMLNHPLAFMGGPLHMSTKAWCKTAQLKGRKAWRDYFRKISVAEFDMRPRFLHNRAIHLPQRTGLALRLLGNGALVLYNPDRCYLQCDGARTVLPILSHYPPIQKRKMDDEQDERDVRSAIVHWEGCARSIVQAELGSYRDAYGDRLHDASGRMVATWSRIEMEGGKDAGEGSSRRKRQAERRSSRRRVETPPNEEEIANVEMEMEEEVEAPVMNVEEERKKRAKAMKSGEMRARVSWTVVLAVFLAFPPFQRERVEEMGFGEIFRMNRMRADSALTQALRSRWDAEVTAFVFAWGHMIPSLEDVSRITGLRIYGRPVSGYTYPCYHDLAQHLLELPVERRSSLVPRVPLQESLGLFDVGKGAEESEDEHLDRLVQVSRRELESDPGAQADLNLRRFLVLFLSRLLFATRGDAVHCRFMPLLEDLSEVGGYAWGAAFLAHQFDSLGASERQTSTSGFFPFLQLERLQEAIDSYPYLDVAWQLYLGEGVEGQPWLVQSRPYFGRSVWLHALNLVLPLHLYLSQRSLGLRKSAMEFPVRDRFYRPGRSFWGLHETTDWCERAKEQIDNWERRGKAVKLDATTDDAYLQTYALKYGGCNAPDLTLLSGTRSGGGVEADRGAEEGAGESEEHRSRRCFLFTSCRGVSIAFGGPAGGSGAEGRGGSEASGGERDLQLTTEHAMDLQGQRDQLQGEVQTTQSERDQLRIRAEAAEAQVAEATKELVALRVQRSPGDQEEVTRLRAELLAQQAVARSLQQIVTDIGHSRSRSGASASRATGASVGQYLAGSSSRRRNEEEERRRRGKGSAQSGRGGGEMPPPPDRQEGSGESGGGQ